MKLRWFDRAARREALRIARLDALLDDLRAAPPANTGEWLARLVRRIRPARGEPASSAAVRMQLFTQRLAADPRLAAAFRAHLVELLTSRMHRILYADSGVITNEGFAGGLARRVLGKLLPPPVESDYLRDLVEEVFDHPRDHAWLAAVPREGWEALLRVIDVDGAEFAPARRQCRHEAIEAMRLASARLAALGTDPVLLRYLPALARHESPFLVQVDEVREYIVRHAMNPATADDGHLEVLLGQCDGYVEAIRKRSREAGVDVNLVFLLVRIEAVIERLRRLRDLVTPAQAPAVGEPRSAGLPGEVQHDRALDFFVQLVRQENRRNSVRDLMRGTTELLARRVTEQASRSGEHYITESRGEFVEMFRAAAGAGLLIGVMALLKILIGKLGLPLLWEGVAFSLNYGLGFVLIHVLHFTIATKQPAMTAATLAASLDGREGHDARLDALAELAAEVSRSQWVSIAGNVIVTLIVAFAIALTAGRFLGWYPVEPAKAAHLLADLHPWRSLALLYAAIAGVYLFLSGLISGYYDNLSLYYRVPQRLRRVRWLRVSLGPARLERLAGYVEHNLGALAGNFLFGCMLGFTPIVGVLLGLPLDIRHVAFASANLAYGLNGLDYAVPPSTVVVCASGVLLVGLTNLLVSFGLALRVALRSRGIGREQTRGLAGRVLRRFLEGPRDFFWPPAAAEASQAAIGPASRG